MGDSFSIAARSACLRRALLAGPFSLVLAFAAPSARAGDGLSISMGPDGSSNGTRVELYRAGAQSSWNKRWLDLGGWHVGGYWEFEVGYWNNSSHDRTNSGLGELAFTPVFRLQQDQASALSPYVEIGVGAHLLSETSVSTKRDLSTAFQFGSHAGVGARFGPKNAFDIGYRYQHLSNAGIKDPNDGIDFHILRLGYWFK